MESNPRHIRHAGLMIDASFNRDGSIQYYVVERGIGRFYSLDVAKEIAEARAKEIAKARSSRNGGAA